MNFKVYLKRESLILIALCGMFLHAYIVTVCRAIKGRHDEGRTGSVPHTSPFPQANTLGMKWRMVNSIITDYDTGFNESLQRAISAGYEANHPEVISLVRTLMDPPSHHIPKTSRRIEETPQTKEILQILKRKVKCTVNTFHN